MALVYKHIRKDNNEVFYIGIGRTIKRAKEKFGRSNWWSRIVNKYGYEIEIIEDNLTWDEVCKKEIELIKLYGRKDLGLGSLVNMTDGGEGSVGTIRDKQTIENHKTFMLENNPFKGKTHSDETKNKISKTKQGSTPPNKKVVLNLETGIFYDSIREASDSIILTKEKLVSRLNGNTKNNTSFICV